MLDFDFVFVVWFDLCKQMLSVAVVVDLAVVAAELMAEEMLLTLTSVVGEQTKASVAVSLQVE